jgi:hypothetical protein
MTALYLGCGLVHAWRRGYVDLNEFDGKALVSEIRHRLFSTFGVAAAHQHQDAFGCELPGDFSSNSFVRACNECDRFNHRIGMIPSPWAHPSQTP